jgi:hypothetical protein
MWTAGKSALEGFKVTDDTALLNEDVNATDQVLIDAGHIRKSGKIA